MYYVLFSGTVNPSYASLSEKYYITLLPLLEASPGFIEQIPYASLTNPNGQLLLAKFADEDSIQKWRKERTHLRIQRTGREKVFEEYRIRIGPGIEHEGHAEERPSQVLLVYQRPPPSEASASANEIKTLVSSSHSDSVVWADLNDQDNFQSASNVLWVSSWKSDDAAVKFEKALERVEGDSAFRIRVVRDYGKEDRREVMGKENEEIEAAALEE